MPAFETLDPELRGVLGKRIRELGLKLEGSPVEPYVRQLYKELERRGLHKFRPVCYLTDEWGCPDMQPVLGIPFYLADPNLGKLERAIDDLEDSREIMRYMRHEAGHVFNYAYRLYARPDWIATFGPFDRPYRDKYRPVPFSRNYVRHMEGWYAQKHPDEDFAETFAVWLTPGSAWRRRYKGWPALRKLRYVDRMARMFGDQEPIVRTGEVDITVDDMRLTVGEFYKRAEKERDMRVDMAMDVHLSEIFLTRKPREGRPAAAIVTKYRRELIDKITYWTGVRRAVVRALVEAICKNCERLKLWGEVGEEPVYLVELTAFGTTLAMNFLTRGTFTGDKRRSKVGRPSANDFLMAGKLKVIVLYDRWEPEEDSSGTNGKAPLVRTLDKKEVEEEVIDALTKLGHEPTLHELDGSLKSLHALPKLDCDIIFNLSESFAGNDTADYNIAAYLELVGKPFTGSGSHGLMLAQDKSVAKKIFAFHRIATPIFARSFRGRLAFSDELHFPVIVKPMREDGSIGIEFNAVVSSIKELMERIDWLHEQFDSPILIEEYVEGREMYVGVLGNENPEALPVIELDLSNLPEGTPRIAAAEVKWGKGTKAYRDAKSIVATDLSEETTALLQSTAVAAYQALELRDYGRVDMRLKPDGTVVGHRSESQSVARLARRAGAGRAQGGAHLQPADRRNHRHGHA